ncbi:MAG: type III pantothenate kinase [Proteobacteria bacterium]|nr:type III pantothenate kinase [Pseudomonadota bacterium]MBU4471185.1 type III pantothenate kinase [Pseudomonadota bacterium]MCG2753160.1 type III pantothenate kinase [Desulfobacteraceae bacterium]
MLLAVDVGNTNIVFGVFDGPDLLREWRTRTNIHATADELGMFVTYFLSEMTVSSKQIEKIAVSSVVPPLEPLLSRFFRNYFNLEALWIRPETFKGMPIQYTIPSQVGADRLVNAFAGFDKYGTGLIVIDLGTATTFDVVSDAGEYLGGAICPGIRTAMESLYVNAPRLPRIQLEDVPEKVIGTDSVGNLKSGILFGYAGLVDGMVHRIKTEMGADPKVIATGGLSRIMEKISQTIEGIEPDLTLQGIRLMAERD